MPGRVIKYMESRFCGALCPALLLLQILACQASQASQTDIRARSTNEKTSSALISHATLGNASEWAIGETTRRKHHHSHDALRRSVIRMPLMSRDNHLVVTFDDGPNDKLTPKILDALAANDVKAIFFMTGCNIKNPALMHRMASEGHILGSHTFGHSNMAMVSNEKVEKEINDCETQFQKIVGDRPWFFRFPYGSSNSHALKILKDRHYQVVHWTADTYDWQLHKPEEVIASAMRLIDSRSAITKNLGVSYHRGTRNTANAHEPEVMLMHEHDHTAKAQRTLLPKIKKAGWTFSNPIDILSPEQKKSLLKASCSDKDTCAKQSLTRPWCCLASSVKSKHHRGLAQHAIREAAIRGEKHSISVVRLQNRLALQIKFSDDGSSLD